MTQTRDPQKQNNPQSGTDYNAVSNPYDTSYIKQTFWDKVANAFGARSSYDIAESERLQNQALWNSQMSETKRQELYNSAAEVRAREEAAGLNPALSGQTIGGGSSDNMSNAPMNVISPQAQPLLKGMQDLGTTATQVVQLGLGLATGMAQLEGINLSNASQEITNLFSLFGLAENEIKAYSTTVPFGKSFEDMKPVDYQDNLMRSIEAAYIGPKRYKHKYGNIVGSLINSDYGKGLIASIINKSTPEVVNASGNQRILGNFNRQNIGNEFKPITDFTTSISKVQSDLFQKIYSDYAELKYNHETHQFEYEISSYDYMKANREMNDKIMNTMRNLVSSLSEQAQHGKGPEKFFSNGLLMAMSVLMQNMLPNISIGSSNGSSWREGNFSGSQNSSKSFGLTW